MRYNQRVNIIEDRIQCINRILYEVNNSEVIHRIGRKKTFLRFKNQHTYVISYEPHLGYDISVVRTVLEDFKIPTD